MGIGVIGAGGMGGTLARHLARLGHRVSLANSRGPESLAALTAEVGATPVSVIDAAQAGEIVILAIPTKAVADLPRALFANSPSRVVVIDIGNYHTAPNRRLVSGCLSQPRQGLSSVRSGIENMSLLRSLRFWATGNLQRCRA